MKKIFIILIVFTIIFSIVSFGSNAQEVRFKDIKDHWANENIQSLAEKDIIKGYEDGTFRPNKTMTNAEFTKILISTKYKNIVNSNQNHWAENYINTAIEIGILKDGEFKGLDDNITRGQMAKMIVRSIEDKEDLPQGSEFEKYKNQITDVDKIPGNDKDYVVKAYGKGIITGYVNSSFKYEKTATRAESSTMIVRMLDQSKRVVPIIKTEEEIKQLKKELENKEIEIKDITEFEKYPINTFLKDSSNYVRFPEYKVEGKIEFKSCEYAYKIKSSDLPVKIDGFVLSKIDPQFETVGKGKNRCIVVYQTINEINSGLYLNLTDKNFNILRPRNNYFDWTKPSENITDEFGNVLSKTYYGLVVLDRNSDWKTYNGKDAYYAIFNSKKSDFVVIVENPFKH